MLKNWSFFSEKNVKYIRGLPLIGVQWRGFFRLEPFPHIFKTLYDRYPNEKFIGIYDVLGAPRYVIRDPELIKRITIKDFDHFVNHHFFVSEDSDPMFGRSMFIMRDQRWRDMRTTLSPAFTGRKMRLMFSLIGEVSETFSAFLKTDLRNGETECNVQDLFARFSIDAIASTAFGLNVNSVKDTDNEFYKFGMSLGNFNLMTLLKLFAVFAAPKLARFFNVSLFSKKDQQFFRNIVMSTIKYREENNVVRNDMINLLIEAKRGTLAQAEEGPDGVDDMGFATVEECLPSNPSNRIKSRFACNQYQKSLPEN